MLGSCVPPIPPPYADDAVLTEIGKRACGERGGMDCCPNAVDLPFINVLVICYKGQYPPTVCSPIVVF